MARLKTTRNGTSAETSRRRGTIASYTDYRDAERAVDWLSDQGFAVERSAIIGTVWRSVEQVTGRMTVGRAALNGAGEGMLIGALFALLFGIFFSGPDFGELLVFSLAVGASFGGITGAIIQAAAGQDRNFGSTMTVATDHYEVQVDEGAAADAKRILATMPAGDGAGVQQAMRPRGDDRVMTKPILVGYAPAAGIERRSRSVSPPPPSPALP